jgi:hypothetical protein
MTPQQVFDASDAAATVELYRELCSRGPVGHVAQCFISGAENIYAREGLPRPALHKRSL